MVKCIKLGRELPGLTRTPYPGELGQRIFENVSQEAWNMWLQHMTLVINHYGLSMADPRATEILKEELEAFFFGEDAAMPKDRTPPEQEAA
jgi:Fe-S cluster biosynthesis and repair protein YggX